VIRLSRLVVLVGLTACVTSSAPEFTAAHRAAIVDSVQAMLAEWRTALNAKDFAKAATFYSTDSAFRWYEDGAPTFHSARAIRDTMLAMRPGLRDFNLTLTDPEITALGPGAAIVTSEFTEKLTDTTGKVVGFAAALSVAVVHDSAGWRLLVGHNSSLRPPPDTGAKKKRE